MFTRTLTIQKWISIRIRLVLVAVTQISTPYPVAPTAYLDSISKQQMKRFTLKGYLFSKAVNAITFFRRSTSKYCQIGINYFPDSDTTTFSSSYFLRDSWTIYFYYHRKKNDLGLGWQKLQCIFPKQKMLYTERACSTTLLNIRPHEVT